jgi:hypothetical protein
MADVKLFSATRPGGWRNGIGDPGRRLLAVDEGLFPARARGRVQRQGQSTSALRVRGQG